MLFEKDIESFITREVEKQGGLCLKFGQDGWPDRIVLTSDGRTVWLETKRPDGEMAQLQKMRAEQLRRRGHSVCEVWDKSQARRFVLQFASVSE